MQEFLGEIFVSGGTIGALSREQGNGDYAGVYIIVRPQSFQVRFDAHSRAGRFNGQDPTVSPAVLKGKWVDNADILYIGESEATVKKRMQAHIKFWNGKPIRAWGGRIIAQICDFENLEVWYLSCDDPKAKERDLLRKFKDRYGKLPFANWR